MACKHPLIRFYEGMMAEHPEHLVLMLWGDFYEALGHDAVEVLVEELGMTGTVRDCGDGTTIPMAGFPKHTLERYLKRLTDAGYKVLVAKPGSDGAAA